jgi:hypothetical protein
MRDPIYRRAIELLEADINDELVALEPDRGNCFGFNSVATTVWKHLEVPRSSNELKAHLLSEYDVSEQTCENELRELLDELEAKGLVSKTAPR